VAPGHAHGHTQAHAQPPSSRGVDPSHPGPSHPDANRLDPSRLEPGHPDPSRLDANRLEPGHPDASHPDPSRLDPRHLGPAHPPGPGVEVGHGGVASARGLGADAAHAADTPSGTASGVTPGPRTEPRPSSRPIRGRAQAAERHDPRHVATALPWYGLDAGWQGPRALGTLSTGPDGLVEFGTLRHGDPGAIRPDSRVQRRAVTVLTMARLSRRPLYKADGRSAGFVEAMTVGAAAALAGVGLVEDNWPWELEASVRQYWLDQQRELAYVLSESLGADPWRSLTIPVGDDQQMFQYRESTYGWVMAAARPDCFIGAFGRGVSAYSLAFVRVDPAFYS
jgi:hypothetical protein